MKTESAGKDDIDHLDKRKNGNGWYWINYASGSC
jgi:hypothetical protein